MAGVAGLPGHLLQRVAVVVIALFEAMSKDLSDHLVVHLGLFEAEDLGLGMTATTIEHRLRHHALQLVQLGIGVVTSLTSVVRLRGVQHLFQTCGAVKSRRLKRLLVD